MRFWWRRQCKHVWRAERATVSRMGGYDVMAQVAQICVRCTEKRVLKETWKFVAPSIGDGYSLTDVAKPWLWAQGYDWDTRKAVPAEEQL